MLPILENSRDHYDRIAIIDAYGAYTYGMLHDKARQLAGALLELYPGGPGPVLMLAPSGFQYVALQWAIWLSGGIAVPVHTAHPAEEVHYMLEDTGAALLLCSEDLEPLARKPQGAHEVLTFSALELRAGAPAILPAITIESDALIIYTSGTTGRPKGVVISHKQLDTQLRSLSTAWGWSSTDRILNVLPMHHVHGLVNITCCALYNGAVLEMRPSFDPAQVAARMSSGELSLFMAVPTIYHKLIGYFEQCTIEVQQQWQQGMQQMRLMVSGSAALPVTVLERWLQLSGHTLLERYGMTEIGMALSNPLEGVRKPGYVGLPLPFVTVKLVDEQGQAIEDSFIPGELYVCGATVFRRYWKRPEETDRSFSEGWFRTGDIAERDAAGYYKILGRSSSDIIKSGGYKISALEIENVLLEHPQVSECAVVALPSEEWGETIAVAIVGAASQEALQHWLRERLAPYKQPRRYVFTGTLPRNAMGKVLKTAVKTLFT